MPVQFRRVRQLLFLDSNANDSFQLAGRSANRLSNPCQGCLCWYGGSRCTPATNSATSSCKSKIFAPYFLLKPNTLLKIFRPRHLKVIMSTGNGAREYHDMSLPATSTPRPYTASHDDDRDSNAPEVADSEFSSPTTLTTSSPHGTHSTLHSPTAQQAGLEHYTPSKHFQQDEGKIAILSQEQYTTYPEVVASPYSKKEDTPNIAAAEEGDSAPQPQKDRKILGMRRKIFFLVLALVCIIIAAAVGGGVGASASHNSSKSPDPTPAPSPSSDVGASR